MPMRRQHDNVEPARGCIALYFYILTRAVRRYFCETPAGGSRSTLFHATHILQRLSRSALETTRALRGGVRAAPRCESGRIVILQTGEVPVAGLEPALHH